MSHALFVRSTSFFQTAPRSWKNIQQIAATALAYAVYFKTAHMAKRMLRYLKYFLPCLSYARNALIDLYLFFLHPYSYSFLIYCLFLGGVP